MLNITHSPPPQRGQQTLLAPRGSGRGGPGEGGRGQEQKGGRAAAQDNQSAPSEPRWGSPCGGAIQGFRALTFGIADCNGHALFFLKITTKAKKVFRPTIFKQQKPAIPLVDEPAVQQVGELCSQDGGAQTAG